MLVTPAHRGGYGLDAQWSEDLHHALHAFLADERTGYYVDFGHIADIVKALNSGFVYDGTHSVHRGTAHGGTPSGIELSRFVGFTQNHDQIGNRAMGERIGLLAGRQRQKIAAALVLLSPMIPLMFMGEEWGASTPFLYFTDHQDATLAAAVSQARTAEFASFGWDTQSLHDPQALETLGAARLRWDEVPTGDHADMLQWYTALLRLRRDNPGAQAVAPADVAELVGDGAALRLRRGNLTLVCNCGDVDIPSDGLDTDAMTAVLTSEPAKDGWIPPLSAVVFRRP